MYDAYGLHILTTSRCKNPMKQRSTSFSDSLKLRERSFKLVMDHRKSTMFSIPEKHLQYLSHYNINTRILYNNKVHTHQFHSQLLHIAEHTLRKMSSGSYTSTIHIL